MGYLRFKFCVLEVVDCAKFELTTLQMNIFAKTKKVGKLSLACFERTRVECFKQYMGGGWSILRHTVHLMAAWRHILFSEWQRSVYTNIQIFKYCKTIWAIWIRDPCVGSKDNLKSSPEKGSAFLSSDIPLNRRKIPSYNLHYLVIYRMHARTRTHIFSFFVLVCWPKLKNNLCSKRMFSTP